jgi:uncharacterized protein YybS (DUF2232 family)
MPHKHQMVAQVVVVLRVQQMVEAVHLELQTPAVAVAAVTEREELHPLAVTVAQA